MPTAEDILKKYNVEQSANDILSKYNISPEQPQKEQKILGMTKEDLVKKAMLVNPTLWPIAMSPVPLKTQITASQFAGGFTPQSPIIQGAGELAKSWLNNEDMSKALPKAIETGVADAALTYGPGLIAKGLKFLPKKPTVAAQYNEIGNKIGEAVTILRKEEGKRVGAIKSILKQDKTPLDVHDLVTNIEKEIANSVTPTGGSSFSNVELKALKNVQAELMAKGGQLTSTDLFNIKEKISNDLLNTVRRNKAVPNVSSNGERVLFDVAGNIGDVLTKHDDLVTGGQLRKVNQSFKKAANTYEVSQQILGSEKNLSNSVKTLANKIAEGDPFYADFAKNLNDFSPKTGKFFEDLNLISNNEKMLKTIASIWGVKDLVKAGSAAKTGLELGKAKAGRTIKNILPVTRIGLEQLMLNSTD